MTIGASLPAGIPYGSQQSAPTAMPTQQPGPGFQPPAQNQPSAQPAQAFGNSKSIAPGTNKKPGQPQFGCILEGLACCCGLPLIIGTGAVATKFIKSKFNNNPAS